MSCTDLDFNLEKLIYIKKYIFYVYSVLLCRKAFAGQHQQGNMDLLNNNTCLTINVRVCVLVG